MASQIQPKNNEKKQTYCILSKKAIEKNMLYTQKQRLVMAK